MPFFVGQMSFNIRSSASSRAAMPFSVTTNNPVAYDRGQQVVCSAAQHLSEAYKKNGGLLSPREIKRALHFAPEFNTTRDTRGNLLINLHYGLGDKPTPSSVVSRGTVIKLSLSGDPEVCWGVPRGQDWSAVHLPNRKHTLANFKEAWLNAWIACAEDNEQKDSIPADITFVAGPKTDGAIHTHARTC